MTVLFPKMTLSLLKDLCLIIGLVVIALARLRWHSTLLFYTHLVVSIFLATSWSLLLLLGNDSQHYLTPSVVLILVTVVLDKLWWHWSLAHNNIVLFVMFGARICNVTLAGLDQSYFAMGFGIPYLVWIVLAMLPGKVAKERPYVNRIDDDSDNGNSLELDEAVFKTLDSKLGHGFRK